MNISISGQGWTGNLLVSTKGKHAHVIASIYAADERGARVAIQAATDLLTLGRKVSFRAEPTVERLDDFESKATTYQGHARFSFETEGGEIIHLAA